MVRNRIEKVIYDPAYRISIRELIARLEGQIKLFTHHEHTSDEIKKILHELEFDFEGCYFTHDQYKTIDHAREIIEEEGTNHEKSHV